jgi:hypothetical protein
MGDPDEPYARLGERIATSKHALPIPPSGADIVQMYAAAMGSLIRDGLIE